VGFCSTSKILFFGGDLIKKDSINEFLGKYCKTIIKGPCEEKTHVLTGVIPDFDQDEGSIVINSSRGVFYLNVDTILSIKPQEKLEGDK